MSDKKVLEWEEVNCIVGCFFEGSVVDADRLCFLVDLADSHEALRARVRELEGALSDTAKCLDSAVGDAPDCDCPPEGHFCGYPVWLPRAKAALDRARQALAGETPSHTEPDYKALLREVVAECRGEVVKLSAEHVDWAKCNPSNAFYDPDYKPVYPSGLKRLRSILAKAQEALGE